MAIARDASTQVALGTSPQTGSHTCAADSILFVGTKCSSAYSSGVTYNGVSMTRIADVQSGAGEYHLSLFYILNPASGSNTISASVSTGSIGFTSISYLGADTSSQPGANNTQITASGTTHAQSLTTTVDNSWVIGYFSSARATLTAGANTNFIEVQVNNVALADSNGPQETAGSYTMNTSWTGSGTAAGIMAEIKIDGGGGVTFIPRIMMS